MTDETKTAPRLRMVCSHCGSEEVKRDAWATWSTETQEWELSDTFDNAYCDDCDGETSIDEEPA